MFLVSRHMSFPTNPLPGTHQGSFLPVYKMSCGNLLTLLSPQLTCPRKAAPLRVSQQLTHWIDIAKISKNNEDLLVGLARIFLDKKISSYCIYLLLSIFHIFQTCCTLADFHSWNFICGTHTCIQFICLEGSIKYFCLWYEWWVIFSYFEKGKRLNFFSNTSFYTYTLFLHCPQSIHYSHEWILNLWSNSVWLFLYFWLFTPDILLGMDAAAFQMFPARCLCIVSAS